MEVLMGTHTVNQTIVLARFSRANYIQKSKTSSQTIAD